MALKLVVDTLDGIDDSLKTLYVEKDGKFRLDVDGVEDVSGLKSALEKERTNAKTLSRTVKELQESFSGIDIDSVKKMMAKAENDQEAKLIAEGKINEVMDARLKKHQELTESEIKKRNDRISALEQKALENIFRGVAGNAGVHQKAIDDVLLRGKNLFKLDENGNAVQLGPDGSPIYGKDGKTPFSPAEWIEGMKKDAPHWWPASSNGSGSSGSGAEHGTKTMTRQEFNTKPPNEQMEFVKNGGAVIN